MQLINNAIVNCHKTPIVPKKIVTAVDSLKNLT